MYKRLFILTALVGVLAWSCSSDSPTGGGGDQLDQALAGGGRLSANDPFTGRVASDSGGYQRYQNDGIFGPDTIGHNWRVLYYFERDCANQPGEQVISDSAAWHAWWSAANDCYWSVDSSSAGGWPGDTLDDGEPWFRHVWPDTHSMGHNYPDSSDTGWNGPDWPPDTAWSDTIPPGWHGNPFDSVFIPQPYEIDFNQYAVATIAVEYDSGAFCFRTVNVVSAALSRGEFVIRYEVSKLIGNCCNLIMAPMIQGAGAPVIAVLIEKPTAPVRFERTDAERECWLPDADDPLTLDYTFHPCNPVANEHLITNDSDWEQWWAEVHGCDTIRIRNPYPDTMLWVDTLNGGMPGDIIILVSGAPTVDFSRYAVIVLSAEQQMQWGGGIWLKDYTNGDNGAIAEYAVMVAGPNCPPVNMTPGHMTHTTAIKVLRPTNNQITWRRTTEAIDCNWADTTVVDSLM